MAPPMNERLARVLQEAGITLTDQPPGEDCEYFEKGQCAKNGTCWIWGVLNDQAQTGGLADANLTETAVQMVSDGSRTGCTVFTITPDRIVPPHGPGILISPEDTPRRGRRGK